MYKEKAIEKIQKELKAFTGGNKEKAVSKPVAETLEMFCKHLLNPYYFVIYGYSGAFLVRISPHVIV